MPSIDENKEKWGKEYNWKNNGDEWSEVWGGTPYIWAGTVLPRIIRFVPCETIVEIGSGYGRFSQYLRKLCKKLIIVDLNKNCIETCKKRFGKDKNVHYIINDGKTLKGISDNSVDFIFSWDTLVHCDDDTIKSYIFEAKRILKKDGNGLFHHSNYGIYPENLKNKHWFSRTMTSKKFSDFCKESGLLCRYQEIINCAMNMQSCISFFTKTNKDSETKVFDNKEFHKEVDNLKRISQLYNPKNY